MSTTVVHCKKAKYDVYIGRPSKWGNPFSHLDLPHTVKVSSRDKAVEKFNEYILVNKDLLNDIRELKDKVLGCWCSPQKCHGDVLAELANKLV